MSKNSEHSHIGATFQRLVRDWFGNKYDQAFELEKKIAIGNPPKDHKFDIVCTERKIAIECKRYTWTKSWNVPSAKMGFTNEAVFYLSFLPDEYTKYIVMYYSYYSKRAETLAEYYYRRYKHLIGDVHILEYNPEDNTMRDLCVENNDNKNLINELNGLLMNGKTDSDFIEVFSRNDLLVQHYYKYMTTSPIEVEKELERLPNADIKMCCALMTMLLREDHFNNGIFERRIEDGSVGSIVRRILELLE